MAGEGTMGEEVATLVSMGVGAATPARSLTPECRPAVAQWQSGGSEGVTTVATLAAAVVHIWDGEEVGLEAQY